MSILATRTPAPSHTKNTRPCGRCGRRGNFKQDPVPGRHWCVDCRDVEPHEDDPKALRRTGGTPHGTV